MSEQLQHLIERIRAEGVDKADAEARAILEKARTEAARIEREARDRAVALVKKAEAEAAAHAAHGRKALEQASRDTLLTVRQSLESLFDKLFRREVEKALTHEAFQGFLQKVVQDFLARQTEQGGLEVTVPTALIEDVRQYLIKTFQAEAAKGVTIRSSNEVITGFRVAFTHGHVELDFTPEAIAETLARLVRPDLGALLREATGTAKGQPAAS